MHPKGVLLWSLRSIELYQERCWEDIVYLDATGSSKNKRRYFFEAFQTDVARTYGQIGMWSTIMLVCDGLMVLMQAICLSFAKKNLHDTINHYYSIASGKATKADFEVPILHR